MSEEEGAGVMTMISPGLLGLITVACLWTGQSSAFGRSVEEESDNGGFIGDFFQRFAQFVTNADPLAK